MLNGSDRPNFEIFLYGDHAKFTKKFLYAQKHHSILINILGLKIGLNEPVNMPGLLESEPDPLWAFCHGIN